MQSNESPMSPKRFDRKAAAIAEFTMKQYTKRISTWVILSVGLLAVSIIMLFYFDTMMREIDAVDNDYDSFDPDGDGYPSGQERLYGTDPYFSESHPGKIDPSILPDDPSKWINEDDIDWDALVVGSVGYDDDGDCRNAPIAPSAQDGNRDGIACNVRISENQFDGSYTIRGDGYVDEDPDDEAYAKEAIHRATILALGKFGFVFLIGIFLPLFMATGLIRDEMESGTMHFLIAKPIRRAEIFLYRLLGFLAITYPYVIAMSLLCAILFGFSGPSDSVFRLSDIGIWMVIAFATLLAILVYGMMFSMFGVLWKHGIILAIPVAAWELAMMFVSLWEPEASVLRFSVLGWATMIIDAGALMLWPDMEYMIEVGMWGGGMAPLQGAEQLMVFSSNPGLGLSNFSSFIVGSVVLLIQALAFWFVGSALFSSKEVA
jgi:hypothetical protein